VNSHSERARQWVHMGSGLFALLLRALTWWQAAALAVTALAFNVLALPRVGGRRLYRPVDEARGFPLGILLYPLSVLLLILVFPNRLDIAAAAWAVLAFGDGAATLVGQRAATQTPHAPLSWNRDKTVAGTTAFIVCGGAAAVALELWTRPAVVPRPSLTFAISAPIAAAIVAAFIETIPSRLDDNISVPAGAGAVLWIASLVDPVALHASRGAIVAYLPWAIVVNAGVSFLGYKARTVSTSGTIGGAIIGTIIFAAGGWRAWLMLFVTFALASIASRLGLKRKVLLGIAEERGGRRGAGNAIANCGVAAVAAIVAISSRHPSSAWLAFVAALTAGGSDTVASEIGKAWGRSTFLITTMTRVRPGTPGAMSMEGTAAGVVAALGLASIGAAFGLTVSSTVIAVVIGATVGALVESALGATLEAPGILNNDMLNFINTAVAAAVTLALA
jgi:uncharacterized protein (TIGR00297 family)